VATKLPAPRDIRRVYLLWMVQRVFFVDNNAKNRGLSIKLARAGADGAALSDGLLWSLSLHFLNASKEAVVAIGERCQRDAAGTIEKAENRTKK
jgi:hypothetical protein